MFKSFHKLTLGVKQWVQVGKDIQYEIYTNEEFENKTVRRNSYRYLTNKYFPVLRIFSWNSRGGCSYSKRSVKHLTKLAFITVRNKDQIYYWVLKFLFICFFKLVIKFLGKLPGKFTKTKLLCFDFHFNYTKWACGIFCLKFTEIASLEMIKEILLYYLFLGQIIHSGIFSSLWKNYNHISYVT